MLAPDHLQHQQLVEVGVQQAADNRVQAKAVVIGAFGEVHTLSYGFNARPATTASLPNFSRSTSMARSVFRARVSDV